MRFVMVLVLGGCNFVFDIEPTAQSDEPVDHDGDQVATNVDNCPVLENRDQADLDGDLVGDACDPCPGGTQLYVDADVDGIDDGCDACARGAGVHDEDGDGFLDACDNCPALANPEQTNIDGDDAGDACDPDPAVMHRRVAFAGFDVLPPEWVPSSIVDWSIENDTVGPLAPPSPPGPSDGLWNRSDSVAGSSWSIVTGTVIPAQPPMTYTVGVAMRTRFGIGTVQASCDLSWNQTQSVWFLVDGQSAVQVVPTPGPVVLQLRRSADQYVECEHDGVTLTRFVAEQRLTPTIYTGSNVARFAFVDLLE